MIDFEKKLFDSFKTLIKLSFTILLIISAYFFFQSGESKVPEKKMTRAEKFDSCFNHWDGSVFMVEYETKKIMNDPDSFQHIETKYSDSGKNYNIFMKFRGKNAFGGYVVESVSAELNDKCEVVSLIRR